MFYFFFLFLFLSLIFVRLTDSWCRHPSRLEPDHCQVRRRSSNSSDRDDGVLTFPFSSSSYFAARLEGSMFESSFASFVSLTFTTANLIFLGYANVTQGSVSSCFLLSFLPSTNSPFPLAGQPLSTNLVVDSRHDCEPRPLHYHDPNQGDPSGVSLSFFLHFFLPLTSFVRSLFFVFLIVSAIVLAASASLLQNGVVALSSSFGPSYLNQIMSGQGAIGFSVAMVQFIAAYGAAKEAKNTPSPSPSALLLQTAKTAVEPLFVSPPDSVRTSAFVFFLSIGIFAGVSWLAYFVLVHLPLYRLVIRANSEDGNDASSIKSASAPATNTLKVVERKVRHLGIAMFICFGVTLSVFPSVTATIQSVKVGAPDARLLQSTALFVPLGFAVFAGGDWMGRVLPQIEKLVWTNWKVLMGCSVGRIVFIVRFFLPFLPRPISFSLAHLSSYSPSSSSATKPPEPPLPSSVPTSVRLFPSLVYLHSSTNLPRPPVFFLIMFLFAISNGYLSTLIMLAAVSEPSLEEEEVEVAATCLAFYLTCGLAGGSFVSFGVLELAKRFV